MQYLDFSQFKIYNTNVLMIHFRAACRCSMFSAYLKTSIATPKAYCKFLLILNLSFHWVDIFYLGRTFLLNYYSTTTIHLFYNIQVHLKLVPLPLVRLHLSTYSFNRDVIRFPIKVGTSMSGYPVPQIFMSKLTVLPQSKEQGTQHCRVWYRFKW